MASNWYRILLVTIIVGACPHLIFGLITVYKTDRTAGVSTEIRTIHDEAVWLPESTANGKDSSGGILNGTIKKAFVHYHDSNLCNSVPKRAPKSKVPWVLLAFADTALCSPASLLRATRSAGYIGLILHSSGPMILRSFVRYKFEEEMNRVADRIHTPASFISDEDGHYLRESFVDHHEVMYYVKIDKPTIVTWTTWATPFIFPFYTAFAFIYDVGEAFCIVLGELVYKWIFTAYVVIENHGIVSFMFLCLPVFVLVYAAFVATSRIPHPFFGYHFPGHPDDFGNFDKRSDQEAEDSNTGSRGFSRSDRVNNNILLKHYETLGISPDSTYDKARAAYFNLSKRYHPDKSEGQTEAQITRNTEKMKNITAAWRELKIHLKPSSAL